MPKFSSQELDKILKSMPMDLKTAVFSEETANSIERICKRNKIGEDKVPGVATLIGNVLIGMSPPEEFPAKLQQTLGIDKIKANKITQETNRLIFFPVQKSLDQIYRKNQSTDKTKKTALVAKRTPKKSAPGSDTYRETLEIN